VYILQTYTSTKKYSSNHGYQEETTYEESSNSYGYPQAEGGQDNYDPEFNQEDFQEANPNYPQPPHSKYNPGPEPGKKKIKLFICCVFIQFLVPYGGMATHHTEKIPGNEFYLHVDPSVEDDNAEDFQLSNCNVF
jgi:hypothetical protein